MKFSLRITLLMIFSVLIGTTVLVVGIISYRNARFTANNLARQLLAQTMARIDSEINNLLGQATKLNALTERRLKSGQLRADDFDDFVRYSLEAMELGDQLSGFFIGLESTGESVGVSNLSVKTSIRRSKRDPRDGTYEVCEFCSDHYPAHPVACDHKHSSPDIRTRPWYVQARQARRSVWTDVFVFTNFKGMDNVHGLTYATPVYGQKGELLAVLDSDYALQRLCRFLGNCEPSTHRRAQSV